MMKSFWKKGNIFFLMAVVILWNSACKTTPPPRPQVMINESQPWLTDIKEIQERPKVALVLSGGSSKGFAHIGVIRMLEQEKIPIDFIVGTSVGSLIGVMYGACKNSFELEWLAFSLESDDIFDFTLLTPTQGYVKGERLLSFIKDKVGSKNLEQLRIPIHVTATDLQTGELVLFSSGPVESAVRASVSIPVLFPPAVIDNHQFVDGGVVDNVPADAARQKGADIVIAVDVSKAVTDRNLSNIKDYALQSISIMMALNSQSRYPYADVVIHPDVSDVTIWDFTKKKKLMSAGIEAARESLPKIRECFRKWYRDKIVSTLGVEPLDMRKEPGIPNGDKPKRKIARSKK